MAAYGTFNPADKSLESERYDCTKYSWRKLFMLVYGFGTIALCVASIVSAVAHWDAPCYEFKLVMSLSVGIIIISILCIFLMIGVFCAMVAAPCMWDFFDRFCSQKWTFIGLFFLNNVVFGFGLIELIAQYEKCLVDAKIISILAVVGFINTNLVLGSITVWIVRVTGC